MHSRSALPISPPKPFSLRLRFWLDTLSLLFSSPWKHRSLIVQMVRREVVGRYRGSMMGLLWSFLNPVLMLGVYTFVFSVVFNARWGVGSDETKADFALILFVGMIVHGIFAECVNRAPSLILGNVNFVKKVVFPIEILPWVAMGATLFHAAVSVGVWGVFFVIIKGYLPWTIVFLPLVALPLVLGTLGFAWFLAATGVYLRDVSQTTGIFTTVLMFLSPIFYPASALPESYRGLLELNPLTFLIEQAREVMVWDRLPDFAGLAAYTLGALAVAVIGLAWFQKTRRGFADVL
jgi:lipopolysaccharide transport system permease protein